MTRREIKFRDKRFIAICSENRKEYFKRYRQLPEVKIKRAEYSKKYRTRAEYKEYKRKYEIEYRKRPEAKARIKQYYSRPDVKERMRNYAKKYRAIPEKKAMIENYYSRPDVKAKLTKYRKEHPSKYSKFYAEIDRFLEYRKNIIIRFKNTEGGIKNRDYSEPAWRNRANCLYSDFLENFIERVSETECCLERVIDRLEIKIKEQNDEFEKRSILWE